MACDRRHKYAELCVMIENNPKPDIEGFLERENITSEECHRLQAPSPLCAAALINSPDLLKYFISLGFDPNALGAPSSSFMIHNSFSRHFAQRPIHVACCTEWYEDDHQADDDEVKKRKKQSRADNLEVVRILVNDHKVDVNVRDEADWKGTPLYYAAEKGRLEIVKLLVEAGADLGAEDNEEGYSPLHSAAMCGDLELCEYFLSVGASVDVIDRREGRRPLHFAVSKGHVDVVKVLLDAGADVNKTDWIFDSPLLCASMSGNLDVVRLLVSRGANVQTDEKQNEFVMNAIRYGNNDIVRYFLVEKGVSPNVTDCYGCTALFEAMDGGNTTAAKLLVACGCSLDRDDINKFDKTQDGDNEEYEMLVDRFKMMSENPRKLQEICCIKTRSLFGENIVESVNALQIPNALKDVLLLKNI